MKNILILIAFLCTLTLLLEINAKPAHQNESYFTCFKFDCPSHTSVCKKYVKTNGDKSKLVTTVECLNRHGDLLKIFTNSENNPYDRNADYSSFAYRENIV